MLPFGGKNNRLQLEAEKNGVFGDLSFYTKF